MINMTYFLTSMIGPREDKRITSIYRKNLFLSNLKARWKQDSRVLIMPAYLEHARNDGWIDAVETCLSDGELSFRCIHLFDKRNLTLVNQIIGYDVVVLAGGHVPSQNAFFEQIGLREKLRGFAGIIIGISAGSMNCASTVYAHVERPGETVDPNYKRFLTGLGITDRMILPHYQEIKD